MVSFVQFALLHKKDDTAWGDVARDIAADPDIHKGWHWKRFIKHINENHPMAICVDIMEEMYEVWSKQKNVPSKV